MSDIAWPKRLSDDATVWEALAVLAAQSANFPSDASCCATARPMPLLDPVIRNGRGGGGVAACSGYGVSAVEMSVAAAGTRTERRDGRGGWRRTIEVV